MTKKLRKMPGDRDAPCTQSLLQFIDSESKATVCRWCLDYAEAQFLPIIVLIPQCPENEVWEMQFYEVMELLKFIEWAYEVDLEREYLTGISFGAYGVWNFAMLNPSRFAAIIPVCGGATFRMKASVLKDLPIWAFHGRLDKSVPFEESEQLVNTLKAVDGKIRFSEYPDLGHHEVCSLAYENKEIYDRLLKQKRKS